MRKNWLLKVRPRRFGHTVCLPFFTILLPLLSVERGRADEPVPEVIDSSQTGLFETDRPGELENPFSLAPGQNEFVTYVSVMNAAAREDAFGSGGSSVLLDAAVRFGVLRNVEGVVTIDSFLASHDSDETGGSTSGVGYATLLGKWNFFRTNDLDAGVSIAPFVRLPIGRSVSGTGKAAYGLIAPFDFELGRGWEIEGSTGLSRVPGDGSDRTDTWENQVSLQREVSSRLTVYAELQLENGDGLPTWATEFGGTIRLSRSLLLDLGGSLGLGRSHVRMAYAGLGARF